MEARRWVPFDDVGCDCGALERGIRYGVRVCLLNSSKDILTVVGISQRGAIRDYVAAKFDAHSFVPGMTRFVELTIRPDKHRVDEFFGTVDIFLAFVAVSGRGARRGVAVS